MNTKLGDSVVLLNQNLRAPSIAIPDTNILLGVMIDTLKSGSDDHNEYLLRLIKIARKHPMLIHPIALGEMRDNLRRALKQNNMSDRYNQAEKICGELMTKMNGYLNKNLINQLQGILNLLGRDVLDSIYSTERNIKIIHQERITYEELHRSHFDTYLIFMAVLFKSEFKELQKLFGIVDSRFESYETQAGRILVFPTIYDGLYPKELFKANIIVISNDNTLINFLKSQ